MKQQYLNYFLTVWRTFIFLVAALLNVLRYPLHESNRKKALIFKQVRVFFKIDLIDSNLRTRQFNKKHYFCKVKSIDTLAHLLSSCKIKCTTVESKCGRSNESSCKIHAEFKLNSNLQHVQNYLQKKLNIAFHFDSGMKNAFSFASKLFFLRHS